jgi:hypothetical protein
MKIVVASIYIQHCTVIKRKKFSNVFDVETNNEDTIRNSFRKIYMPSIMLVANKTLLFPTT